MIKQLELQLKERLLIVEDEIWIKFPENNDYMISNLGKVKSLKKGNELILKQRINKHGYLQLGLWKQNKMKSWKVHVLVAICFLGHKPCGMKLVINHKDLNRLNNNVSNLEITTPRENSNRKHLKSSSKYVGVSFNKEKQKFISYIHIKRQLIYLGSFEKEIDAHTKYKKALKNLNLFNGNIKQFREKLDNNNI